MPGDVGMGAVLVGRGCIRRRGGVVIQGVSSSDQLHSLSPGLYGTPVAFQWGTPQGLGTLTRVLSLTRMNRGRDSWQRNKDT